MSKAGKITVFFCTCGDTLSGKLDFEKLSAVAREFADVASVKIVKLCCQDENERADAAGALREDGADRVVFAGCTPALGEHFLEKIMEDGGLHPGMLMVCNLREQCAWAVPGRPDPSDRAPR